MRELLSIDDQEEIFRTLRGLLFARASGVRRVRYGDREIEYRTDEEMAAAIKEAAALLNPIYFPGIDQLIAQKPKLAVRTVRFHTTRTR